MRWACCACCVARLLLTENAVRHLAGSMRRIFSVADLVKHSRPRIACVRSTRFVRMHAAASVPRCQRNRGHSLDNVVVIGAGFAGLAAAKTLEERSTAHVTLVEASSSIGGRARSALLSDGQKVELGATWLHGSKGHPVYNLAVEYGLMQSSDLADSTNFWKGSRYFCEAEATALEGEEEQLARTTISAYAEAMDAAEKLEDISVAGEHLQPQFEKLYRQKRAGSREADIVRDAWHWRELLQRNMDGSDHTSDSAVGGLAEYNDLPGPWGAIPGGYQTVAERIADDLGDVRRNWVVQEIQWGEQGISIRSESGKTLHADAVILTVSLGVLKERHRKLFKPPLPEAKAAAIQRLGIGVVDKVFITFQPDPAAPQPELTNSCNLFWQADAKDLLPGAEPVQGRTAIERCFGPASYPEPSEAIPWHAGVYSLRFGGSEFIRGSTRLSDSSLVKENVPDVAQENGRQDAEQGLQSGCATGRPTSAVAWIASHHAVNMEHASEGQLCTGINAVLDAFPSLDLPRSFKVVRSCWGKDPFTRGSYSYVSAQASIQDVDRLAEPLRHSPSGKPRVLFAGEALSKAHMGTTTGAFLTGQQAAETLIAAFGAEKTSHKHATTQ